MGLKILEFAIIISTITIIKLITIKEKLRTRISGAIA